MIWKKSSFGKIVKSFIEPWRINPSIIANQKIIITLDNKYEKQW